MTAELPGAELTIAEKVGAWVSGLRSDDLPHALREKMRDHLLDTAGAIILGMDAEPTRIASRVFRGKGAVPTLGDDAGRTLVDAVRINAIAAHANEIDDTEGCDHTGAVVMSTLLALISSAEVRAVTGNELLTAAAAGYEIGRRMQNAFGGYDTHNSAGWHSTATCGVFAAAAAASRLLRMSPTQTTSALGLAASRSAGTWAFSADGSMSKQLHTGNAAGAGIESALLAASGATGPASIFDDVWGGIFRTYTGREGAGQELVRGLGKTWHASHSAIKMYAVCRSAHPTLDGFVDLLARPDVQAERVRRIRFVMSPYMEGMIGSLTPQSVVAARMSLPTATALLLTGHSLKPSDFDGYESDEVRWWTDRMRVDTDPHAELVRAEIDTADEEIVIARSHARGSEAEPFTSAEVRAKFLRLTSGMIAPEVQRAYLHFADGLGDMECEPLPRHAPGLANNLS